jgi:hypothetical protein
MIYVAMAIGGFYVFAGFVVMRAMIMDQFMNKVLAALSNPSDAADQLRARILSVGADLTLASGAALAILSPLAVVLFAANILVQGGYLVWAERALPPQDAGEAKGRQQTRNAFVIYLAASAFVGWLAFQGLLRDVTTEALAIDAAIIAGVVLAACAAIHLPKSSSRTSPFEPIPTDKGDVGEQSWRQTPSQSPSPTRLRLAPEFQCHPLWDADTGESLNVFRLGLPEELAFRIEEWDDSFQATLNENDPATSDFASGEARAAYVEEGRAIAAALKTFGRAG